jgi:hypothetical protein
MLRPIAIQPTGLRSVLLHRQVPREAQVPPAHPESPVPLDPQDQQARVERPA